MRTIIYPRKMSDKILRMLEDYRNMVNYLIDYSVDNDVYNAFKLRDSNKEWFKSNYNYASHYLHSASSQAVAMVKSWNKKKRKGSKPVQHKLIAKLDQMIGRTKVVDNNLLVKITIQPRVYEEFLIPMSFHKKLKEYSTSKIGEITIGENYVYLPFQYDIPKVTKKNTVGIDINFNSMELSSDDGITDKIDLSDITKVQNNMMKKRKKIQTKLSKNPQKLKKLYNKYHRREHNRIKDRCHKKANEVIEKVGDRNIVMEDLKNIRNQSSKGKKFNRGLNRWIHGKLMNFIEYRSSGIFVTVNPRGTSSCCSVCGGKVTHPTWKVSKCKNCKITVSRDGNASINILNRGYSYLWSVPLPPNVVTSLVNLWIINDVQNVKV